MPILLLTRPRAQSDRFAASLTGCLARLPRVVTPLIDIVQQPLTLDPTPYATLIFTSENGVASFAAQSPLRARPAWCVGPRTEAAAREAGLAVTHRPDGGTAEALITALRAAHPDTPLLHLRGAHAVTDLSGRLSAAGLACDEAVVYAQQEVAPTPEALALLAGARPVLLPLFSPRSARLAARMMPEPHAQAPVHVVAISEAAAARWRAARQTSADTVTVARQPDATGMIAALTGACERLSA
ncbi:uroporphyrinogen-III synthase [Rhodobaculum claviforme]|nr:uroporphyrinogen-III synthase [Rhodobaculum claviforme]